MRNIKLILQFDGSRYHGWQIQPNAVTIQAFIESAIIKITGEKRSVIGCGRTDSGVHARAYVCNFMTNTKIPVERLPYALNTCLPRDVVCTAAEEMPENFHAAFSAVKKRYTYYIDNARFHDIFSYSWHYPYPLSLPDMQKAASAFLGTHDFIGFAASGFTVKTTTRTIYDITVEKENHLIAIDVTGNGFLYNMVRIMAGTLAFVGSGKINPDDMPQIITSGDRKRAGITAPPEGLFLSEVYYEE